MNERRPTVLNKGQTTAVGSAPGTPSVLSETWRPDADWAEALRRDVPPGKTVTVKRGEYLFRQGEIGDRFYLLLDGKCLVTTGGDSGQESILNIMGPGSLIGEAGALLAEPRHTSARVIELAVLISYAIGDLPGIIERHPHIAYMMLHQLAGKQRQVVGRLRSALFDPPEVRVARFLVELHETQRRGRGGPLAAGTERVVEVRLTHEAIGNVIGLSRVTVTRALQRLRRSGQIRISGHEILLPARFAFEV